MPKKQWDEPVEKIYANVPQSHKVNFKLKLHSGSYVRRCRGAEFIEWFEAWKLRNSKIKASHHHKKSDKLYEQGKELSDKFGINDGEIDNIFDILEQEHPEL